MDIRNFFAKKGAGGGAGAASGASGGKGAKPKSDKSPAKKSRVGAAAATPPKECPSKVRGADKPLTPSSGKKKEEAIPIDSDDEDEIVVMSRNRKQRGSDGKQPPRKRKLVVDGSDDDDEDFMAENSQDEEDVLAPKESKKARALPKARDAVSPPARKRAAAPGPGSGAKGKKPTAASNTLSPTAKKCRVEIEIEQRASHGKTSSGAPVGQPAWKGAAERATPTNWGKKQAPKGREGCFEGLSFVCSGVLDSLKREEMEDLIKTYGGKVTGNVSGKTSFLVLGSKLEDGRNPEEGSKYRKAKEKNTRIIDEDSIFDMLRQTSADDGSPASHPVPAPAVAAAMATASPAVSTSQARNPYAASKAAAAAAAANPYGNLKKPAPAASKGNAAARPLPKGGVIADPDGGPNQLWTDKYRPMQTSQIIGNQGEVKKLKDWLRTWDKNRQSEAAAAASGKKKSSGGGFPRAALISGPPGIGKTSAAIAVAREMSYHVTELNASDTRSKKSLESDLATALVTNVLDMKNRDSRQKRIVVMDEVDGMGAGDRGGLAELTKLIKTTRVPIICICNDRGSPKMRGLAGACLDLKFKRPMKSQIAKRMIAIAAQEGLEVDENAAEMLSESGGNDIRQIVNALQMWRGRSSKMTYKDAKDGLGSISKDELLRLGPFDAAKMILAEQGAPLRQRFEAFFVDYSLIPLLIGENWITAAKGPNPKDPELMDRMARTAAALSDAELVGAAIRGDGASNWSLLPTQAAMNVRVGSHIGRGMLGWPNFPSWLGKNSTTGKRRRLLGELMTHMSGHVSGDTDAVRLSYIPTLRSALLAPLVRGDDEGVRETIDLLDEYSLSRDDLFESLAEFIMPGVNDPMKHIPSASKSKFTRLYNQGVHSSQALVEEMGVSKRGGKKAATLEAEEELVDIDEQGLDAVKEETQEDDQGQSDSEEAILKAFRKSSSSGDKKSAGAARSGGGKKKR